MRRIYVAGPISGHTLETLANIERGIKKAAELVKQGYNVYCPHLDFQMNLTAAPEHKLTVDELQRNSMAWLEVSDAVFLLPGWRTSKGTMAEIRQAMELGIPITGEDHQTIEQALTA